ncbi:cellulose biosynthesis protein BcsC [Pseudomonas vancouverensis]|uniref:Tetratricopeptide repeat protein n=1 Tax=Pseudomonas vancouverensis TaxID=95300 RepID=A0A1H2PDU5_PSEVA|nr:cellulose biosynthesis protein BcsC [Pseudomonas vancouverensis]KAB0493614.1 tetratricopeptide repeat protein [Pseudomonas vancouverensis]TDB67809.1 tetratricopeptide repeat protein [Pseudomonas vancouverensis]SDV15521.1 Tfp pilus assembly protein PilF [Pseudomonas vancouverensis]
MHPRRHTLAIGIFAALIGTAVHAETNDAKALLVEQGQYWQARDNAARAAESWQKVLRLDPNQVDALYGMGLIGVKQSKPAQAQEYLARLQALSPRPWQAAQLEQDIALTDPQNIALLDEARRLADGDQRDQATVVFRKLFAGRTPEGKIGREYYTNLGFNDADWPEARKGLERLSREMPDDSIVALFLAKHLVRHEDSRAEGIRALAKLTKRVDIAGDADQSWRLALVWMGPPTASEVPLFEDFLKEHPDDQEIRDLMSKGKSQSTTAAAPVWQQDPMVARGLAALEKGDQAGAEQAFAARLKNKPDDADALGGLGVVRQQQNRLGEAEQLLNRAIANGGTRWKPALNNVRYWALLQQARDQAKTQPAKAQDSVAQAMRLNPNGVDARLTLADIQAQSGQLDAAQANYRQVLSVQRGNPQAVQGLVNVLAQTGQADEALRLLDTLTPAQQAEMGGGARLRALRSTQTAKLAEQRGDSRAAQQALMQAVQDDPDNVWTRFDLARLYLKAGESQKARDLIDSYLKAHPSNIDALYTSTLLSVEMEQWNAAQATMSRIPAERRTADMNQLADQITLTVQIKLAATIAKRGQRQDALALLDRLQPAASRSPDGMATLAAAYVDAGDSAHAQQMMRDVIAQSRTPSADLMLQYANLLLKTGDDAQVNSILRGLQNQPMSVATRKRFDDVLYQYRIRQADILRENGDLAGAYDTLAPALAARPGDAGAVSALARMYASSGDNAKAFELYKPLLQRQPNDPQMLLNAADAAVQAHDNGYAERALDQFQKLQNYDPQSLTEAARIYRAMGKSSQATELLRKAVAIEQDEQKRSLTAQANSLNVAPNPFVGKAGQRNQVSRVPVDSIPAPAQAQLEAQAPVLVASNDVLPPDAYPGQPLPRVAAAGAARQPLPAGRYAGVAGNPFAPQAPQGTVNVAVDQASSAQRALDNILQERSAYVTQGVTIRSNDSESGLSKMTDTETPLEINIPSGENRYAVRVTPVSLNAGSVGSDSAARFGGGGSADGAGSQRDSGVGLSVAYARPDEGIKADLGTTPIGFKYSTAAGGVSVDRPLADNSNVRYGVNVSRRPVTDSVTSFAGTTDDRTGQSWGGVTANGARAQLSYDDQQVGTYGYGSWHKLLGHNVESNSRTELGGGVYWYLHNAEDSKLTLGLSATGMSFENNQDFFTYGHGGYFSPQSYFALGVPVAWSQRTDRFSYQVKGSVGVQYFDQDAADYFPNDKDLQAASNQRYSGQTKTGVGYSLSGAGEYKFGSNFFLGANLGVDNAQDYKQFTGAMYLRYMFEDMNGSMELPVSPYRSPYSN